ncbi:5-formyltetrahydrofolate cyclo-ligase [termite gut metagenome]|uniref:5-formyltetrahydrofolate cyclo-ligase n=1 Tax=termite gut metagenome TaxID=433724 RepID=A0A5J4SLJ6_9ZZZZ
MVCGERLELRIYNSHQSLSVGPYGIKEPFGEAFTDYASIDLAVIPGVAFDRFGNRLGHGKGYYDRLLPHLSAYRIGIGFSFQLVEEVPAKEFDVRMNEVITPSV